MKLRDYLGISPKTQMRASRFMQILLAVFTFIGVYTGDTGIIVNSLVGLLVTFLPGLLERDYNLSMDPALVLWITSAVFLHGLGTLGPYQGIWWWDHATHLLSASVVAGVGYATIRALDEYSEELHFPPKFLFAFILVFVLAFGVLWELLEFGISGAAEILGGETVLTQYGLEDTMKDLVFNTLGGVAVAIFGEVYLSEVIGQMKEELEARTGIEKPF